MISGSAKFMAFCILKNTRKKTEFEIRKSGICISNPATLFSWLEFLPPVKEEIQARKIKRSKIELIANMASCIETSNVPALGNILILQYLEQNYWFSEMHSFCV